MSNQINIDDGTKEQLVDKEHVSEFDTVAVDEETTVVEFNMMKNYVKEEYKGFLFKITRNQTSGYYCGYVLVDEHPKREAITAIDLELLYTPHGDYTANYGFDCVHYDDTSVARSWYGNITVDRNKDCASYKTYSYCKKECQKIIDSIILQMPVNE